MKRWLSFLLLASIPAMAELEVKPLRQVYAGQVRRQIPDVVRVAEKGGKLFILRKSGLLIVRGGNVEAVENPLLDPAYKTGGIQDYRYPVLKDMDLTGDKVLVHGQDGISLSRQTEGRSWSKLPKAAALNRRETRKAASLGLSDEAATAAKTGMSGARNALRNRTDTPYDGSSVEISENGEVQVPYQDTVLCLGRNARNAQLAESQGHVLWVGSNGTVEGYDLAKGKREVPDELRNFSGVRSIKKCQATGVTWIAGDEGLFRVDKNGSTHFRSLAGPEKTELLLDQSFAALEIRGMKGFAVTHDHRLLSLNLDKRTFEEVKLPGSGLRSIYFDKTGRLFAWNDFDLYVVVEK